MGILFQGAVVYNGQNIAYRISEMDDKRLDISISFLIGPNENNATFLFNKVDDRHWSLDREQTKSDINIDLKFEEEKQRWVFGTDNLLGCGNIQLVYTEKNNLEDKEEPKLIIEKNGSKIEDIGKTESDSIDKENDAINLDLDRLIETLSEERGIVGKFVVLPIVKGLCEDLERTVKEQSEKQQTRPEIEGKTDKIEGKIVSKEGESQEEKGVARNTILQRSVLSNTEKTATQTKSPSLSLSRG